MMELLELQPENTPPSIALQGEVEGLYGETRRVG
jgi:hypothetical protein